MARPESHDDIADYDKTREWASFDTTQFLDLPTVVSAYAAFASAAQKFGAKIENGVVTLDKTTEELDALLETQQQGWDRRHERYTTVRLAVENFDLMSLDPAWRDNEHWTLRMHAKNEGLPVFDLISKDDSVRTSALAEQHAAGVTS